MSNENINPELLHEFIQNSVNMFPDKIAIVHNDKHLSYRALDQLSDRLHIHLSKLGVQPGTLITVSLECPIQYIICVIGVMKSGAVYVPLDLNQPKARLTSILNDCAAPILILDAKNENKLPIDEGLCILLDQEWDKVFSCKAVYAKPTKANIASMNLAYIIYTSGTTGKPKGVMITHQGVANIITFQSKYFSVGFDTRSLQFAALTFDASISEIFVAFAKSSTLFIPSKSLRSEPLDLLRYIANN